MTREKVIEGLETALAVSNVVVGTDYVVLKIGEVKKVLELLKEQEPVKPKYDKDAPYVCEEFRCGVCDQFIRYKQPYCCNCGRRVKWG